ncbi:MAG TPA: glutamate racemase [Clostridia bacterium]|nr:glutamate racemase [Clostridia bacterium]
MKTSPKTDAPIGVFDSGIGGLTVLKTLRECLPGEHLIYVGDLGRSPYGTKSADTIKRYARQITRYLLGRGVKLIVIACNTASAVAGDEVRRLAFPIPVVEVVESGAVAALDAVVQRTGEPPRIGVLGTEATVSSGIYKDRLLEMAGERGMEVPVIEQKACPLFVGLAEEGLWRGEIPDLIAAYYLGGMKAFAPDVVILGCTHFPLLTQTIAGALPSNATLSDSASFVAKVVQETLRDCGLDMPAAPQGAIEIFCSDTRESFRRRAERFLDMNIDLVHHVDLESYEDEEDNLAHTGRHGP